MNYDTWKSTEPDPHEFDAKPTEDQEYIVYLEHRLQIAEAVLRKIAAWKGYMPAEAALRKIAAWKGYMPHDTAGRAEALTLYEKGANNMLATLKQIAEEALS